MMSRIGALAVLSDVAPPNVHFHVVAGRVDCFGHHGKDSAQNNGGHDAENQKRKGHGVFLRLRWCAVLDGLRLLGVELEVKLGAGCRGALEQYRRSLQK